ncbi:hypothetical protein QQY66_23420 [Streptomyces sp. DG2A-72]|uniref:hypothetical protein n=1 Tax=Streptomyces sp. DG2A-72 TaxID=3051386 RepID=UPI00265C7B65|nr:hypothetical protein [Streptomyces sp. DG2A-72]MDO0934483.1 hypothetical protein [Streptomyces sp. DG2A-72]
MRIWSRVLVLLLALLVPGEHTAHAVTVTAETTAVVAEYDDTVLRSTARAGNRAAAPLRPAPRPHPRPAAPPAAPPLPAPTHPEPVLHTLRTVVLRC